MAPANDPKKRRQLVVVCLAATILLVGWFIFSPGGILAWLKVVREIQSAQLANLKLEKENSEFTAEIVRLEDDHAFIEEIARREFGMLKKNEMVFDFSETKKKGRH